MQFVTHVHLIFWGNGIKREVWQSCFGKSCYLYFIQHSKEKFACWGTGIYNFDEHQHVTNCRKYPVLRIACQFRLWPWGKSAENLQICSLMQQVSKRNSFMGKLLKFQMLVRQILINFSGDKISICILLLYYPDCIIVFKNYVCKIYLK